jgi:membrane-bound lytic murein transglycosylase A
MKRTVVTLALVLAAGAAAQDLTSKPVLVPVEEAQLPDFGMDDLDLASLREAIVHEKRAPRSQGPGSLGGIAATRSALLATLDRLDQLLHDEELDGKALAAAIKKHFTCYRSVGSDGEGKVLFTAYHSPCYPASRTRSERFPAAVRRTPKELERGDKGFRPDEPFLTRKEIDGEGKLDGRGLEICYMARLDAYLLEVQGSGSARLDDGTVIGLQCDRSNGHPYTSLGKELVKDGKLTREEASIPAIRAYFAKHPDEEVGYLHRNASYVFFQESKQPPLGSAGAPVTAGRSIATDKRLFPTGALAFVVVDVPVIEGGKVAGWKKRGRFVVDQDTGGAIVGPGRVDLYLGADAAEQAAGVMKQEGAIYFLLAR